MCVQIVLVHILLINPFTRPGNIVSIDFTTAFEENFADGQYHNAGSLNLAELGRKLAFEESILWVLLVCCGL